MPAAPDLELTALRDFPMVREGDDIAALIRHSAAHSGLVFQDGDILVIAQKIISKAEGRLVALKDIVPSAEALDLAKKTSKDARIVQLVLNESTEVLRYRENVLIVAHRLGYVHANAGIDQSNARRDDGEPCALLLPTDPDASAARIKNQLEHSTGVALGVIINDSMGRAWRLGTMGQAIGCAGIRSLWDRRGDPDLYGRALEITEVAVADELAAAASFVQGQGEEGVPVILMRGAGSAVLKRDEPEPGVTPLLRQKQFDLFRD